MYKIVGISTDFNSIWYKSGGKVQARNVNKWIIRNINVINVIKRKGFHIVMNWTSALI